MTDIRDALKDARDEVEFMLQNCNERDRLFMIQLRSMQRNLKRMEGLVRMHDKVMSYIRNHRQRIRSK